MIYKFILAIYITSWIYLVFETTRTWRYNSFTNLKNLGIISMISAIIVLILLLTILAFIAPIICVYYGWNKSKGKILGGTVNMDTNGTVSGGLTTAEEKDKE